MLCESTIERYEMLDGMRHNNNKTMHHSKSLSVLRLEDGPFVWMHLLLHFISHNELTVIIVVSALDCSFVTAIKSHPRLL